MAAAPKQLPAPSSSEAAPLTVQERRASLLQGVPKDAYSLLPSPHAPPSSSTTWQTNAPRKPFVREASTSKHNRPGTPGRSGEKQRWKLRSTTWAPVAKVEESLAERRVRHEAWRARLEARGAQKSPDAKRLAMAEEARTARARRQATEATRQASRRQRVARLVEEQQAALRERLRAKEEAMLLSKVANEEVEAMMEAPAEYEADAVAVVTTEAMTMAERLAAEQQRVRLQRLQDAPPGYMYRPPPAASTAARTAASPPLGKPSQPSGKHNTAIDAREGVGDHLEAMLASARRAREYTGRRGGVTLLRAAPSVAAGVLTGGVALSRATTCAATGVVHGASRGGSISRSASVGALGTTGASTGADANMDVIESLLRGRQTSPGALRLVQPSASSSRLEQGLRRPCSAGSLGAVTGSPLVHESSTHQPALQPAGALGAAAGLRPASAPSRPLNARQSSGASQSSGQQHVERGPHGGPVRGSRELVGRHAQHGLGQQRKALPSTPPKPPPPPAHRPKGGLHPKRSPFWRLQLTLEMPVLETYQGPRKTLLS